MGAPPNAEEFLGAEFVGRLESLVRRFWNAPKEGMTFYNEYPPSVPDFREPTLFYTSLNKLWHSRDHLFDECKRVFFRLTQHPDGALVPLWDLIDDKFHPDATHYSGPEPKYLSYVLIWQLFAWAAKDAPLPVPFDPANAVFTKTSGTFEAIQQLLRGFASWSTEGKKL